jgi:ankyrin repeat protein
MAFLKLDPFQLDSLDLCQRYPPHQDTIVHILARANKKDSLVQLIPTAPRGIINAVNAQGRAPLHEAIDDIDTVKLLLAYGADVELCKRGDCRPLHTAACKGNLEVVKALVEAGASLHATTRDGRTPLHFAASFIQPDRQHTACALYLVEVAPQLIGMRTTNTKRLPVHVAARTGNMGLTLALLRMPYTGQLDGWLSEVDAAHMDVMLNAVTSKNVPLVQCLVEEFACNVHQPCDQLSMHALHIACAQGDLPMLQYILPLPRDSQQDVDTWERWTPLHWAVKHNHLNVIQHLITHESFHVWLEHPDKHARRPLDLAQLWNHTACIALLTEPFRPSHPSH